MHTSCSLRYSQKAVVKCTCLYTVSGRRASKIGYRSLQVCFAVLPAAAAASSHLPPVQHCAAAAAQSKVLV